MTRWIVRARQGSADAGREKAWEFATEDEARGMVDLLMRTDDLINECKDLTKISRGRGES